MSTNDARTSNPSGTRGGTEPIGPRSHRPGSQPVDPNSARALALLTRQPVTATPVPRFHVGSRRADGSIAVKDRATDRAFLVYTPRRDSEFRAGHRAGSWYIRGAGDAGTSPAGPAFSTAIAAIEAIRSPRVPAPEAVGRFRVLWS